MRNQNIILFFSQIILLSFFQTTTSQSHEPQLDFFGGSCSKSENVTINGTYHTNIQTLLTNFKSLSSINQFIIDSSGDGSNRVNSYFLCRPDIGRITCQGCFKEVYGLLQQFCFNKKEAIIWFEECMIRYTNNSVSPSNDDSEPWEYNYSSFNVSKPDGFPELVNTTMKALISKAVSPENTLPFYALHGQTDFTFFEGFYGMVLCRPDLTSEDCESCLMTALGSIPSCCADSLATWTSVYLPNCQLRYDTAPFIFPSHREAVSPSPSSSPTLSPGV